MQCCSVLVKVQGNICVTFYQAAADRQVEKSKGLELIKMMDYRIYIYMRYGFWFSRLKLQKFDVVKSIYESS